MDRVPKAVTRLAAELYEKRTGKNPLPFDQLIGGQDAVYTSQAAPELLEEG